MAKIAAPVALLRLATGDRCQLASENIALPRLLAVYGRSVDPLSITGGERNFGMTAPGSWRRRAHPGRTLTSSP